MKYKFRRGLLYVLARIAAFPLYLLPLRVGVALGALFGRIAYYILLGERKKTLVHLRVAFRGEKSEAEIRTIAKRLFSNLGRNAIEWINSSKIDKNWLIEHIKPHGLENIDRAHERGKGVIFLASHFGNWELMAMYLAQTGYRGTIIARKIYIDAFNKLLVKMRTDKGIGVVYRDDPPKKILRLLKDNGYIGILADQDVRSIDGVFVDFFGKLAYTPAAPVKLAQKTGAAIVPIFLIRKENSNFEFVAEKELVLVSTDSVDETIVLNTQRWTTLLESYIRKYPDHWVWMHRRWKTRPEDVLKRS